MTKPQQFPPPQEQPFVAHLIELRDRLLRCVLAVIVVFLALFSFANDLYTFIAEPLLRHMPQGTSMIATEVASPFLTPFKLTLVVSIFICVPYLLYQLWAFIAPGLYQHERKLVYPLLFSSTVLFYLGAIFAYYVVFPLVFGFLTKVAPEGVAVMTDISKYLDFVLKMFFAFGVAFEVPIATILVIWTGITSAESLAAKRPYVIVFAFVIGMLLTPPDVISQTLLALPMWALFEMGLVFSRLYVKPESAREQDTAQAQAQYAGGAGTDEAETEDFGDNADDSEYRDLTEEEMDAELDRIEDEEDDDEQEPHPEFEPFPEEQQGDSGGDQQEGGQGDKKSSDPENPDDKEK
ncbi:MAG: twin-arginine translocase subunit TatC [Gammaproteobacteria bacterium]|jgi:sec-independent protein translocase protein TatC